MTNEMVLIIKEILILVKWWRNIYNNNISYVLLTIIKMVME